MRQIRARSASPDEPETAVTDTYAGLEPAHFLIRPPAGAQLLDDLALYDKSSRLLMRELPRTLHSIDASLFIAGI
jgi:hypothetical protein